MEACPVISLHGVKKSYAGPDGGQTPVLDVPEFHVLPRQQIALVGESGCGKSTLLNIISGLSAPDEGRVELEGCDISRLSEPQRDTLRGRKIGFVFQSFNLLQGFSAIENVILGGSFSGEGDHLPQRAAQLLERVGLGARLRYFPRQLSVGQQQRVAIARALVNKPVLVLADEPTGSLDVRTAKECLALIQGLCAEHGSALICVTHDPAVSGEFSEIVALKEINRV